MRKLFSKASIPLKGWPPTEALSSGLLINTLSDDELIRLNKMLPWQVFTTDAKGRRLGNFAWEGKRQEPQSLSDPRIHELLACSIGKEVVEVGCLEGVHTIGLCMKGANVTAIDGRLENLVKTQVRSMLYGYTPKLMLIDLDEDLPESFGFYDACFHVGVLYHLSKPIEHLMKLLPRIKESILLDTHIASKDSVVSPYPGFEEFEFSEYKEFGRNDIFSGLREKSRWLTLGSLRTILESQSFEICLEEVRDERHGARVKIKASRA